MEIKYHEVALEEVSKKMVAVLSGLSSLKIAVLFGSALRRRIVRDLDLGIVMEPEPSLRELIRLANVLEDTLGIPVDIIPLRKAPPKLRLKALSGGYRLIVRDHELYTSLLTGALSEAVDLDLKLEKACFR